MITTKQAEQAAALLKEYNERINEAYGLHLDAATAMAKWAEWFEASQHESIRAMAAVQGAPRTIEELDAISFSYGQGDPNSSDAIVQHECTQGELKERNRKDGANERASSRVLLTTIYQFWEDHYRQELARSLGIQKNGVTSDFFGDIRLIRNGIVHHRNMATGDVANCKVLKMFAPGQEVSLTGDQALTVIRQLHEALDEMSMRYIGHSIGFVGRISSIGHQHV